MDYARNRASPERNPVTDRPIVVQKYGGTSVGDLERIRKVATRIARTVAQGSKVAVTVSAMGRTTDGLISLAKEANPRPSRRELDVLMATGEQQTIALLALTLHDLGVSAQSFTGQQAGFLTDGLSGAARIVEVNPAGLLKALEQRRRGGRRGFSGCGRGRHHHHVGARRLGHDGGGGGGRFGR